MKNKPSIAKKVASVTAGTALAASLYANAVYQPRNESALEQALDREVQSVVGGSAEIKSLGDGFVVVEREPAKLDTSSQLVEEIASLEAEMHATSEQAVAQIASAYTVPVTRVAQVRTRRNTDGTTQVTIDAGTSGQSVSFSVAGASAGAFIGTLSAALANPQVAQAVVANLITSVTAAGGATSSVTAQSIAAEVAAAASNGTGAAAVANVVVTNVTVNDGNSSTGSTPDTGGNDADGVNNEQRGGVTP